MVLLIIIVAAVRATHFPYFICFAHIINLVVQNSIKVIKPLQDKVNKIVEYFLRSTVAAEKLKLLQLKLRPDNEPIKLKNDIVTRWNSTYDMFQRVCTIHEPLDAAIAVLKRLVESLTAEE